MPDDFSQDITTTGTVAVGGTATGTLEVAGDRDWFALTVTAGQTVQISLDGTSLVDPYLRVYAEDGTLLSENDDAAGYDSQLTYTSPTDQTIYVEAGAWNDQFTGTYQVSVIETEPPGPLDALDWTGQVNDTVIDVYFAPAGYVVADGVTSEGWTAYEQGQFLLSFAMIEATANVTFNVVTDPA